ncbi:hypothetical protein CDD80_4058 [Ophiocordyceps camponoti-rufipedis]|uniref:RING-type domain-containing protein n=1 Tax=Ophiocordyceps camponoti-rufipedis TaxID=2004952 RepID=A0A2C5ZIJ8_9HYPO|nr:hypothetical protein CDD80_4058 [Ophiocordyceps camponoti-rufipedis]
MSQSQCRACHEPLTFNVSPEHDADVVTVPDDLNLPCGCHFHWECMMDVAHRVASTLECPICCKNVGVNADGPSTTDETKPGAIIAQYTSEDGVREDVDLLPFLTEEASVRQHPLGRLSQALHHMCADGDVAAMMELLRENPVSEELLGWTDKTNNDSSLLHVAVVKQHEEAVWLLLWLMSELPIESFPPAVRDVVKAMNLPRLHVGKTLDIRNKKDRFGRTAEGLARQKPEAWAAMLEAKLLLGPEG